MLLLTPSEGFAILVEAWDHRNRDIGLSLPNMTRDTHLIRNAVASTYPPEMPHVSAEI